MLHVFCRTRRAVALTSRVYSIRNVDDDPNHKRLMQNFATPQVRIRKGCTEYGETITASHRIMNV